MTAINIYFVKQQHEVYAESKNQRNVFQIVEIASQEGDSAMSVGVEVDLRDGRWFSHRLLFVVGFDGQHRGLLSLLGFGLFLRCAFGCFSTKLQVKDNQK